MLLGEFERGIEVFLEAHRLNPEPVFPVDNLAFSYLMLGRTDEARELFERLLEMRTDLGLLSEEYDTREKRLLGNFPQAFSHVGLVNTALNLEAAGRAHGRRRGRFPHDHSS